MSEYNASQRVGVRMNRSARGQSVKRFEQSKRLDTALYIPKTHFFFFPNTTHKLVRGQVEGGNL